MSVVVVVVVVKSECQKKIDWIFPLIHHWCFFCSEGLFQTYLLRERKISYSKLERFTLKYSKTVNIWSKLHQKFIGTISSVVIRSISWEQGRTKLLQRCNLARLSLTLLNLGFAQAVLPRIECVILRGAYLGTLWHNTLYPRYDCRWPRQEHNAGKEDERYSGTGVT